MGLFASKEAKEQRAIDDFWQWFVQNAEKLRSPSPSPDAINGLGNRITKIGDGLVFGIQPGKETATLEISADGIRERFPTVRKVVSTAPKVPGWEIVAFRQPAKNVEDLELAFNSLKLVANDLTFTSFSSGNRASVTVFAPSEGESVSRDMVGAVFIFLDAILGEYAVETKLTVDAILPKSQEPPGARPLPELGQILLDIPGDAL